MHWAYCSLCDAPAARCAVSVVAGEYVCLECVASAVGAYRAELSSLNM